MVLDFIATGAQAASLQHRYLDGPAVDQVLAQENVGETGGDAVLWLLQDNLESVRDVVNNNGQTINAIDYDPFGNILSILDPSNGNAPLSAAATRFLFTGQEWDADLGLYYYAQGQPIAGGSEGREYDPRTGTFLSLDPAKNWVNGYLYAKNSPTNFVDPSGDTIRYIPGRVSLDDARVTGANLPRTALDAVFDAAWDVNNCAFFTKTKPCKLCTEIGIIQIVKTSGKTDSWNPQIWRLLNTPWAVDSVDADMAYGQASETYGGVVRGDPTKIRRISAEDLPHHVANDFGSWPFKVTLKEFHFSFETYVVCLSGPEGITEIRNMSADGATTISHSVTVYAGVSWSADFYLRADGTYDTVRRITSRNIGPSNHLMDALTTVYISHAHP